MPRLALLSLLAVLFLCVPAQAATWQTGAAYKGGKTQVCAVPDGGRTAIKYRVNARDARSGYGSQAQGGIFRVRKGEVVYDYDNIVVTPVGRISSVKTIVVPSTARIAPWIGNRVSLLDTGRLRASAIVRC